MPACGPRSDSAEAGITDLPSEAAPVAGERADESARDVVSAEGADDSVSATCEAPKFGRGPKDVELFPRAGAVPRAYKLSCDLV